MTRPEAGFAPPQVDLRGCVGLSQEGTDMKRWTHQIEIGDIFHADVPFVDKRDTIAAKLTGTEAEEVMN